MSKTQECIVLRFNHFDPTWRRCWDRSFTDDGRILASYRDIEERWISDAIAIIAILMAILLPALSAAKKIANKSVCMGNERQLGLAILSYAGDYDGFCVPWGYNGRVDWIQYCALGGGDLRHTANFVGPGILYPTYITNFQSYYYPTVNARAAICNYPTYWNPTTSNTQMEYYYVGGKGVSSTGAVKVSTQVYRFMYEPGAESKLLLYDAMDFARVSNHPSQYSCVVGGPGAGLKIDGANYLYDDGRVSWGAASI